ncbi:hypothetical protein BDV32DRAFT_21127 [Aspergillus pseudonomiae]|uniref:Uncharacterized protein n=1 Tax=Aspergillus pseudonomiae TaxID=1506151 RepID=A0A5N7CXG5_9EURO|nr:uncharacterized protein BDV37DRAFT_31529 [Aspergillus pseudonomiae]KAB8262611.1 hypothetical protein BDV32DRAFT_21127 [Aspergillus pseudonomiae]KAE8398457.1 hypothetical protein BDV37DRAFT_31529 [Aspergillus pseudonomiae]
MCIYKNAHTVPMPAQPDFNIRETSCRPTIEGSLNVGCVQVEHLAQPLCLKAKICILLGRILESWYLLLNNSPGAAIGTEAMYYPNPNISIISELWQCDGELEYWRPIFNISCRLLRKILRQILLI